MLRATELVLPTAPNQYGTTALVESDFDSSLCARLAPFNTIGSQVFFGRLVGGGVSNIAQIALADTNIALQFSLGGFSGSSDYATCFDQYRLRAAAATFSPLYQTFAFGAINPRIWTVIDYDDNAVATRSQLLQYDTCVVSPPGSGVVRTLIPRMAVAAYSGAFTSFANVEAGWIDMASINVAHYGVKVVVEGGVSGQTNLQQYSVDLTTYWEFRATR